MARKERKTRQLKNTSTLLCKFLDISILLSYFKYVSERYFLYQLVENFLLLRTKLNVINNKEGNEIFYLSSKKAYRTNNFYLRG